MTRTNEDAAVARDQGENVTGGDDVVAGLAAVDRDRHGARAVARRNAGGDAFACLDRGGEGGFVPRAVVAAHQFEPQFLDAVPGQRQADEAAAVGDHEIDRVGGRHLRRDDQIALIFAILVIDQDEHPAVARFGDNFFGGGHRRQVAAVREPVFQLAQRVGGGVPAGRFQIAQAVGVKARCTRQAGTGHGPVVDDGTDTVDELCGHATHVSHCNVTVNQDITLRD